MKRGLALLTTLILLTSLVLVQADNNERETGPMHDERIEAGGQNGTGLGATKEIGEKIKAGNYLGQNGEQIQVQLKENNRIQLRIQNISVHSQLNITQEQIQNRTRLNVKLNNGRNAEIKIMPQTASETALNRLRLKNCNESNNCTIELKEVGIGNQTRLAYELQIQKESRLFGIFKKQMQVQAQVDAETGEIISSGKPWWAFLASEDEE